MYLWQTFEFFAPFSGFLFMFAVTAWYGARYVLFARTKYHEAEFEKRKAVGE